MPLKVIEAVIRVWCIEYHVERLYDYIELSSLNSKRLWVHLVVNYSKYQVWLMHFHQDKAMYVWWMKMDEVTTTTAAENVVQGKVLPSDKLVYTPFSYPSQPFSLIIHPKTVINQPKQWSIYSNSDQSTQTVINRPIQWSIDPYNDQSTQTMINRPIQWSIDPNSDQSTHIMINWPKQWSIDSYNDKSTQTMILLCTKLFNSPSNSFPSKFWFKPHIRHIVRS